MKYYFKIFGYLFIIQLLYRLIKDVFTPFLLVNLKYDCLILMPFAYLSLFLTFLVLNKFTHKFDFFIRLILISFFVTFLSFVYFDMIPNEYNDFSYVENLLEKNYNRTITFSMAVSIIFSGYFFSQYKLTSKDFIYLLIGVLVYFIFFYFGTYFHLSSLLKVA